jgi:two-component system, OmpR family, sensor histidine kinase BaeS
MASPVSVPSPATMKLGITTKAFLAVLLVALAVLLAMGVAGRWSFTRGFVGYMDELALQRIEDLVPRFTQTYAREGSWDLLRNNRRAWFHLMRPHPDTGTGGTPDVELDALPESDLTGAVFRIALIDSEQRFVMGNPRVATGDGAVKRAIIVAGKTVGWLVMGPFQSVSDTGARRFYDEQLHATLLVGGIAGLFAVAISLWIARTLVAPIKQVAAATHRLAAGDYAGRLEPGSGDEVGLLARDFNSLARALEANERMRRDFMADVSHELRTPLSVLRGELEAMEDGVRRLDTDALQSLKGEVMTLTRLVNDLNELALADLGALVYRKAPVAVGEVLESTVGAFRERLASAGLGLTLELAPGLRMSADESRLRQLFRNLVENTLRYTDSGGALKIVTRRDGDELCIDFMDSAPGVPDTLLPKLFERFFRGEASRNRATGGSGLGLAICRSIVEAHDGTISARASPLGGVWVALRFPAL